MTPDVTQAVARLQACLRRTSKLHRAQLVEEALDILLAKPNRTGKPWHLVRNALSDAAKKLRARALLDATYAERVRASAAGTGDGLGALSVELADFVDRGIPEPHRTMIRLVAQGSGAEEIAVRENIPLPRARERLSRSRSFAVREWSAA